MMQTSSPPPARTMPRRNRRLPVVGLIIFVAAMIAALGYQWQNAASSSVSSGASRSSDSSAAPPSNPSKAPLAPSPNAHRGERRDASDASGEADGVVPDGVTVFDDEIPAVAKLDSDLLRALRRAATDAAESGAEFQVNSGWRSKEYQNQLFREAVSKYGSEDRAARWVATAATSPHVSGDAVDIGPSNATAWLSEHGAEYGLCQIYENEPWHYELRANANDRGCPRMYADPTEDPRMHQ
ncbi:M15 family metallopeptidase [Streptomyces alfalfae]